MKTYRCKKQFYGGIVPRRATNEDMLQILKGEKLADFIYKNADAYCMNKPECVLMMDPDLEIAESECKKCVLEWLKQPAEVR